MSVLAALPAAPLAAAAHPEAVDPRTAGEYRLVVEGYDWGAAVSKVIDMTYTDD